MIERMASQVEDKALISMGEREGHIVISMCDGAVQFNITTQRYVDFNGTTSQFYGVSMRSQRCSDEFNGILGQTFMCRFGDHYRFKNQFEVPENQEYLRLSNLLARTRPFGPNKSCIADWGPEFVAQPSIAPHIVFEPLLGP